ncbi:DUF397 domain-containing protein [Streptomyces sp. NPDC101166]|uniref:DUF397 domain-containing protein n=1 Tax=Streptomyces sp. NPDC101166 TaxID=3366120 RepID=UPI0038292E91
MPIGPLTAPIPAWFKSSYSGGNTTECLEAASVPGGLLVRDSKSPDGPHITVSSEAWSRFAAALAK